MQKLGLRIATCWLLLLEGLFGFFRPRQGAVRVHWLEHLRIKNACLEASQRTRNID
jgi:uncharacterized protein YjeT (DUF2065 family)